MPFTPSIVLDTANSDKEILLLDKGRRNEDREPSTQDHNKVMKLRVECYSGQRADERPVRFWLEGTEYLVEAVLDRWYEPEAMFYKVRADDGNLYIFRHQTSTPDGQWELVSFRRGGLQGSALISDCD